jgi:hypothetical protein
MRGPMGLMAIHGPQAAEWLNPILCQGFGSIPLRF